MVYRERREDGGGRERRGEDSFSVLERLLEGKALIGRSHRTLLQDGAKDTCWPRKMDGFVQSQMKDFKTSPAG